MSYFKNEFKRAFFSTSTFLALTVVFIILGLGCFLQWNPKSNSTGASDAINIFISMEFYSKVSYLSLFASVIACIGFSTSYILEKKSQFFNVIQTKITFKEYFITKLIVNGIIGGLIFLIPEIIILLFLMFTKGIDNSTIPQVVGGLKWIYYSDSKIIYVMLILIVHFIYGVAFSTLGLGVAALTENKYLAIIIPFLYVIISGTLFQMIGINDILNFHGGALFDITQNSNITILNILVVDGLIFTVGTGLFYWFGNKARNQLVTKS